MNYVRVNYADGNNDGVMIGGNVVINRAPGMGERAEKFPVETGTGEDTQTRTYDIALSYASEQKQMVSRVAAILETEGLKVFFAPDRQGQFAADNMISRFYQIFRYQSRYTAAFVTEDYLRKEYTMFEAESAQLSDRYGRKNHLIPICFGEATLPGLDSDICRIRGDGMREARLAEQILQIIRERDGGQ